MQRQLRTGSFKGGQLLSLYIPKVNLARCKNASILIQKGHASAIRSLGHAIISISKQMCSALNAKNESFINVKHQLSLSHLWNAERKNEEVLTPGDGHRGLQKGKGKHKQLTSDLVRDASK